MNPKLKTLLASRKFWAAVAGLAVIVIKAFRPDLPITEADLTRLVSVIIAYIMGTAIEDGVKSST